MPFTPVWEAFAIISGIADPPTRSMRVKIFLLILFKFNFNERILRTRATLHPDIHTATCNMALFRDALQIYNK